MALASLNSQLCPPSHMHRTTSPSLHSPSWMHLGEGEGEGEGEGAHRACIHPLDEPEVLAVVEARRPRETQARCMRDTGETQARCLRNAPEFLAAIETRRPMRRTPPTAVSRLPTVRVLASFEDLVSGCVVVAIRGEAHVGRHRRVLRGWGRGRG